MDKKRGIFEELKRIENKNIANSEYLKYLVEGVRFIIENFDIESASNGELLELMFFYKDIGKEIFENCEIRG